MICPYCKEEIYPRDQVLGLTVKREGSLWHPSCAFQDCWSLIDEKQYNTWRSEISKNNLDLI